MPAEAIRLQRRLGSRDRLFIAILVAGLAITLASLALLALGIWRWPRLRLPD